MAGNEALPEPNLTPETTRQLDTSTPVTKAPKAKKSKKSKHQEEEKRI